MATATHIATAIKAPIIADPPNAFRQAYGRSAGLAIGVEDGEIQTETLPGEES
jgi:hypothetical protein